MEFASLEQRMAHCYLDMFPPFVPENAADIGIDEQEKFYGLINRLYQLAFDEPLLFVSSLHEDDAYPGRYKKPYNKPRLILDMRKFIKAVDSLLNGMFMMGVNSKTALNKRQREILARLGVDSVNLPAAWKWMSTREGANLTAFSYCLFKTDYPYTSDIYARLLGETGFRKLENWMIRNGYNRHDIHNITASDCKLSLTYANPKWSRDKPTGGFEYKIRHTGISAHYDFYTQKPAIFGLCIPGGMKPYLQAFDSMDKPLRDFVAKHTKQCDACNYCVQTDKTRSRPRAFAKVIHEGNEYQLCTYFPGYTYAWTAIDDELAEDLTKMLAFMDTFAPKNKGGL